MRLIDADAVISFVDAGHLRNPSALSWSDKDVVDMIEARPTIDAVAVVRCADCKYYWKNHADDISVPVCLASPKDDAFCSEGVKKDDV